MGAKEVLIPIATFLGGVIITGGAFLISIRRNAKKLGLPVLIVTDKVKNDIESMKQRSEFWNDLIAIRTPLENVPGLKLDHESKLVKSTADDSVPVAAFNAAMYNKRFDKNDKTYIDDCVQTASAKTLVAAVQKSPTLKGSLLGKWIIGNTSA